jgi:hypothetical protein
LTSATAAAERLAQARALADGDPVFTGWQRNLVVAYIDYAQIARNFGRASKALDGRLELDRKGQPASRYTFTI